MAKEISLDVLELDPREGNNDITVVALADGLGNSEQSAAVTYSAGDLAYRLSTDGTYYIVAGMGTCVLTDIEIPASYNGLPVKQIDSEAFEYEGDDGEILLTSVVIPASVTLIGSEAFCYQSALKSVTFASGSNLKAIYDYAFEGCKALESFAIPDGVTTIAYGAFMKCEALTNIVIPDSVTTLGVNAFANCGLTVAVIGEGITDIPAQAFENCNILNVTLPDNLMSIGESAFSGCKIDSVDIPAKVNWIGKNAFNACRLSSAFFVDKYGWFFTEETTAENGTAFLAYNNCDLGDDESAAAWLVGGFRQYNWYKIDKMVAPTVTLNGTTLTISDSTGLATEFAIYVNRAHKITLPSTTT